MILYSTYSPEFQLREKRFDNARVQMKTEEDYYKYYVDLPGYLKDNVDLEVKDQAIHLKATDEKRPEVEKTFSLERDADKTNVTAKLENGVLEVFVVRTPAYNKKVSIE
eukprot:NODE_592_length_5620_cov_0.720884.p5 type:complete len:109 gc:universal NODE_592_length_5620_cov_0.720884:4800-5126(+)